MIYIANSLDKKFRLPATVTSYQLIIVCVALDLTSHSVSAMHAHKPDKLDFCCFSSAPLDTLLLLPLLPSSNCSLSKYSGTSLHSWDHMKCPD